MYCERLKILLSELGISQRQFALKIGIDAGHFSKIITGKIAPSRRILILIEKVYNVNREWLETGSGDIFCSDEYSSLKAHVIESLEKLDEHQLKAVLAFIKYLCEMDSEETR